MEPLVNDHRLELLGVREPPCLSLYQGTHRRHPANQQDPIRFLQSADHYQVPALNQHEVRLFEGNRDMLDESKGVLDWDPASTTSTSTATAS